MGRLVQLRWSERSWPRRIATDAAANGGHQWSAWRSLLSDSLDQLGHQVGDPEG